MKRYGNIYEKICDMDNLREAHRNARKDKLFYAEVVMVDSDPDKYLSEIREMLINHTYSVNLDDYTISTITQFQRSMTRENNVNFGNCPISHTGSFNGQSCFRLNRSSTKFSPGSPVLPFQTVGSRKPKSW